MSVKVRSLAIRTVELLSYSTGLILTGFFAIQLAQGEVERQGAISAFEDQAMLASVATQDPLDQPSFKAGYELVGPGSRC